MFPAPFCFARGGAPEKLAPHSMRGGCRFSDKILPMKRL